MKNISLNIDKVAGFVSKETIAAYEPQVKACMETLENGTGKGNDFLGWLHLPSSITAEHLADLKATAQVLRDNCEVVVVAGIGGSYLGARAVNTQELTVNNKRELNKKNIISNYDLQMAENQLAQTKAQLAQAEAQLVNAKNNLSYTSVTSPSDGVVGSIPYRVGSLVSPSVATPLTTVADISEMYAYFSMTERQLLSQIREGGSTKEILEKMPDVQLQLIDGTMYADSGRVETISGVIEQKTGSVTMRALFPNQRNVLRSGSTGNVVFPNPMTNVIMIPQSATTEIQDKKFVFVVQPDNTLKNTEIQVFKLNDGKYYYVTEGLKAGDKVVMEGVQNLRDGASITPITPAEKEAEYQKALKDQKEGNIQTAFN